MKIKFVLPRFDTRKKGSHSILFFRWKKKIPPLVAKHYDSCMKRAKTMKVILQQRKKNSCLSSTKLMMSDVCTSIRFYVR